MSNTLILSIETSCDETAIAVLRSSEKGLEILANQISSQVKLHAKWGGVVPNLAAREHLKNFPKLLEMALAEAKITPAMIDLIGITSGPGLIPALLVGVNYAKTLSYLWEKPLLGVHHIEGHIYANWVRAISNNQFPISNKNLKSKILISKQIQSSKVQKKSPSINENCELIIENSTSILFPALVLVVSGGHTQLVLMKDHLKYEIIGQTLDDAVGEAFDKVARILGIGYPGGPAVSAMAAKFQNTDQSNSIPQVKFPRPMLHKKNFDFSFSGLKTAVLYETKKNPALLKDKKYLAEVCHEFQQAAIDVLVAKTIKAAQQFKPKTILLAGGVSANIELRKQLGEAILKFLPSTSYKIPSLELTGDNAAMIAAAAAFRWQKMSDAQKKKTLTNWRTLQPEANLKLN